MRTSPPPATAAAKRALRADLRTRRGRANCATAQPALDALAQQLLATLAPATVFCYLATAGEAATTALVDALLASGRTVLVPFIVDSTTMRATRFPGWSALLPGRLGIPSPPPAEAFAGPVDCVLVPGLGFSPAGGRLGFGAGYYDRWLAEHPAALRIGLCFEYQIVPELPVEAHDAPLDYLVTERRMLACPARRVPKKL